MGVVLLIALNPSSYIEYFFLVLSLGLLIFGTLARIAPRNRRSFSLIYFALSVAIIIIWIIYFKTDSPYGVLALACAPLSAIESLALAIQSKDTTQIHHHE